MDRIRKAGEKSDLCWGGGDNNYMQWRLKQQSCFSEEQEEEEENSLSQVSGGDMSQLSGAR